MEKILSKELLLQNLNSTDLFLVKNSMSYIFDELLKGKQGLVTMQDIVFSQKSEVQAEEFLKNFGTHFMEIPQRDVQKWDAFFNVLEQRRNYISICRMMILNMYLSKKLSKEEKHKCCVWLNNHCQLGNHQPLILKMLSYPEDGKLLLLAKKYCYQEAELSQEELEKVCELPIRTYRKLEIFSLFAKRNKQEYNFSIINELINKLKNPSKSSTQEEKNKMWRMLLSLWQENFLYIDIKMINELYEKKQIPSEIYIKILAIYAHQINNFSQLIDNLIIGYIQVFIVEKKKNLLKSATESLFFLLEQKTSQTTEKVLLLMLKIMEAWKREMWFKIGYLADFRAKMYQGAMSVKKSNLSILKQCLRIDKQLFFILSARVEDSDIENILAEVAYNYPEIWQESLDNILSNSTIDILSVVEIISGLYKKAIEDNCKNMLLASLARLINNLPEKENIVANVKQHLSFMYDNTDLKKLVDNYLEQANVNMVNYLIG